MTKKSLMNEIEKLSLAEQLRIASEIIERAADNSDDHLADHDDYELTVEQAAELDRRVREHAKNPASAIPLDEVLARLGRKRK
jgi:putative addiction module component (TIGR02574 family)